MNWSLRMLIPLLGGCLALPVAAALPPPTTPLQGSSPRASAGTQDNQPHVCLADLFSGPLPGKADYCQGMQAWRHGNYQDGLQLLQLAASWGSKSAQYTLGLIHYGGHHVPTNVALGLAWLKLADERDNDAQISLVKRSAFKSATPAERQQAKDLYRQMRGKYGDKVAAARAWHHLQHWQLSHGAFASGCVRVYGPEAAAARRLGIVSMPTPTITRTRVPYTLTTGNHNAGAYSQSSDKPPRRHIHTPRRIREHAHIRRMKAARQQSLIGSANAGACVTVQTQRHLTQQLSRKYFAGTVWTGTVTVEPLQQVPAPATSSGH